MSGLVRARMRRGERVRVLTFLNFSLEFIALQSHLACLQNSSLKADTLNLTAPPH